MAAEQIGRQLLKQEPDNPDALNLLAVIAHQFGKLGVATALLQKALARHPHEYALHHSLGIVLLDQGKAAEAVSCFRQALALGADPPRTQRNIAAALLAEGKVAEAVAAFQDVVAVEPGSAGAYNNLGVALLTQGKPAEAVASFRRAIELAPGKSDPHSGLLFALHYLSDCDRATLLHEARTWGERHASPRILGGGPYTNSPDPNRRLRIGYVSGDFHAHPVGYFLGAVLAAHDPREVEIFCYKNSWRVDEVTTKLRLAAHHWRSVMNLPDDAAADLVKSDQIDILVDLSGHTAANRLPLFVRKPAPVQATWLGYFDTTGIPSIDYLIADRFVCPEGADAFFVEQVKRLPGSYLCFAPPEPSPPVAPLPAIARGYVTFGCFNNVAKINEAVIALWAEILRALPEARICLKTAALDDPGVRDCMTDRFAAQGVAPHRLRLLGKSAFADYLSSYGEIDIALDPFPYSGGATTVDALWMGVPVISLKGERFVSRMGYSHLSAAGLDELVVDSGPAYVRKAVELASDPAALAQFRAVVRPRLAASRLCDARTFTYGLEAVYREMWRGWCRSQDARDLPSARTAPREKLSE